MSYIGNSPTNIAFQTDTFSGTGSATAFTMSVAPANTTSVLVAITGVLQDPSTYSVSGTTLTFSAAPPSGTNNISARYLGIPASGVTTTAYRTVTNTTATAGQTSFSIPSYTVGYIDVFRNGVYLPTTDYTATTGTTVVLTNAATVGDTITTSSFYVSSVLNAIPATLGSVTPGYLSGNAPQVTVYTSGSGTYTTPGYAKAIWVRIVGGGGGGGSNGASGQNGGSNGGSTTFGSLSAGGGGGAFYTATGGVGTGGDINCVGGATGVGGNTSPIVYQGYGGPGGSSVLGGGGMGGVNGGAAGNAPTGGYGGGGGGAGTNASYIAMAGGAGGGYAEKMISSPSATYSYSVGAGGAGGTGGGTGGGIGGAGNAGVIIVTAYF